MADGRAQANQNGQWVRVPKHWNPIMRIVTDAETLKAHIEAELHAADWATPTERKQVSKVANAIIERLNRPEKVSDITGFPEDDDIEAEQIQQAEEDFEELVVIKGRRRIPGMPREL